MKRDSTEPGDSGTGRLGDYRRMRRFPDTPEPSGSTEVDQRADRFGGERDGERPRFVVQEHHATSLHWDLRLEHEGVLWSFAVPKGIPWSPEHDHLAVHTEDHPLEYLGFSGDIPEGNYGAGSMSIWDEGTYEPEEMAEDKVRVVLHGQRVQGRYALFPTRGRNWMIHRMDPPTDPSRGALPSDLRPMQPTAGDLPIGEGWSYELHWAGRRVLVTSAGGRAAVVDRRGVDLSDVAREVRGIGAALGTTEAVLDGVLVAVDADGAPVADAEAVRKRLSDGGARRARSPALAVMLFDLLWLDGHSLTDEPLSERRAQLEALELHGAAWQTPTASALPPSGLLAAAVDRGFPGLVAKAQQSIYLPGRTSPDWVTGSQVAGG